MSKNKKLSATHTGQIIPVLYQLREIPALVINPNGLGIRQPTIGIWFHAMEKHIGILHNTLSDWVVEINGGYRLQLPSTKTFDMVEINGEDGNSYKVIEVSDWVAIATNVIKHPGKLRKNTVNEVVDFLAWFDIDGFYAQAYTVIKRTYTDRDSRALQQWKQERELGKPARKDYGGYIQSQDGKYGKWTNVIYQGLFGFNATTMRQIWATQAGNSKIARNHIPEVMGLKAIAHCERLVVMLGLNDLREAHTEAIRLTRKKFGFDCQDSAA